MQDECWIGPVTGWVLVLNTVPIQATAESTPPPIKNTSLLVKK